MNSPPKEIGVPIPNVAHAVSVSLPTWEATVGYEEGEDWVVSKMNSGYPRFFIHSTIQELARNIEKKYGRDGEKAMMFPSYNVAKRCREFIKQNVPKEVGYKLRILQLSTRPPISDEEKSRIIESTIGVVFFPPQQFHLAKSYWQHSGEGISSRMGEYILKQLFDPTRSETTGNVNYKLKHEMQVQAIQKKSPSLSFGSNNVAAKEDVEKDFNSFIEQKYGRVLDLKFAREAKTALKRRICGKVEQSNSEVNHTRWHFSEDDVYLYPSGMAAIFNCHVALMQTQQPKKSVCFGFPYVDTLNILKKFGPGFHFLGLGDDDSLDQLEKNLESGQYDIMALFCECPSNPLLKTPNLKRIRQLADKYNFAVVIDETVGNFLNILIGPYADMVASSLTKVFSGDSNVLAGSIVLNPHSRYYGCLKPYFDNNYEDLFWAEDALFLERNSRDFAERATKIDKTALAVVKLLQQCPIISQIYYPYVNESRKYYDEIKTKNGGYGGLMSFLFKEPEQAIKFFNAVNLNKGPSLGTNFTLACPYTILAHYQEIDEIAQWGVDKYLIRISIGLEDPEELLSTLQRSLDYAGSS
jgi:cystathionine gamma-synthase